VFDDPAPRQQHQALGSFRTSRDPQDKPQMLGDPVHQRAAIGAINPDQAQLFAGAAAVRAEEPGSCGVGDSGGSDHHGHAPSQSLDQDRPFAACHLLPPLIAPLPAPCRRLDALTGEAARCGVLVTARCLAHPGPQGVRPPWPLSAGAPLAAIPLHPGPLRLLMREHAPFAAPIDDIKNSLDHRPSIELAVAPTRLGWGDPIFAQIPCGLREVCGVWIGVHPQSVLN